MSDRPDNAARIGDLAAAELALMEAELELYWCPSTDRKDENFTDQAFATTTYFGVSGAPLLDSQGNAPTLTNNTDFRDLEDGHCGDLFINEVLVPHDPILMRQITDGTSKPLAFGERIYELRSFFTGAFSVGRSTGQASTVCSHASKDLRWGVTTPDDLGYYVFDNMAPPRVAKSTRFNDLFFGSRHRGGCYFA